jgi:hypothetical protein
MRACRKSRLYYDSFEYAPDVLAQMRVRESVACDSLDRDRHPRIFCNGTCASAGASRYLS